MGLLKPTVFVFAGGAGVNLDRSRRKRLPEISPNRAPGAALLSRKKVSTAHAIHAARTAAGVKGRGANYDAPGAEKGKNQLRGPLPLRSASTSGKR